MSRVSNIAFMVGLVVTASLAINVHPVTAEESESLVGKTVEDFVLNDFRGREYSLEEFADKKLVVLAILGTECPLVQHYSPVLAELDEKYAKDGVAFIGINPNTHDSITEIAAHASKFEIEFPILKDVGNKVVDQIGAKLTPEIMVLDQERVIRYHGRVDDQFVVGGSRPNVRENYLVDAIDSLLVDQDVALSYTEPLGCLIGRVKEAKEDSPVTYANQISRILQKRCLECHREGDIAPFALDNYEEVAGWADMIAEVVEDNRMPPWHASPNHVSLSNDRTLSDEEKELIFEWVDNGAPLGDAEMLPEPVEFVRGWQLPGEPDLVIPMIEEEKPPFRVRARGTVEYQYFEVDPGFTEDKWVSAVELVPGNYSVVHHILVFAQPPGKSMEFVGGGAKGFLAAYVPGMRAVPFPEGMAKRIPAGSTIIFQVHYTPNGTAQTDRCKLGMVFTEPDEVTHEVLTTSSVQPRFRIPAGDDNHEVTALSHIRMNDYQLLSFMPHMHVRGKDFRYELLEQGKEPKVLIDVPKYDFNWQTLYMVGEDIRLSKGMRVQCVAHFDNSDGNPFNPDSSKEVYWGEQTWEEMMIGYFDVAVPIDEANEFFELRASSSFALNSAMELAAGYDADGDGFLTSEEMPKQFRAMLPQLDSDDDGKLSDVELSRLFGRRRR